MMTAGPLNYLGLAAVGFPNLFHMARADQRHFGVHQRHPLDQHHGDWIGDCIAWLDAGLRTIRATEEAEAASMEHVLAMARQTVYCACNSWYLGANIPGEPARLHAADRRLAKTAYAERCARAAANG